MEKKKRGWTGLPRGQHWNNPEVREAMLAARDRPLEQRLSKFLDPLPDTECWLWKGSTNGVGYGKLTIHGKQRLATHVTLESVGRPQPSPDMIVLHSCDNPPCCNPAHLSWGTFSDNTTDAYQKGRVKTPNERGQSRWSKL